MKTITGRSAISNYLGVSVPENIGEILSSMDYGRRGVDEVDSLLIPESDGSSEGFVRFRPFEVSMMSIGDFVGILSPSKIESEGNKDGFHVVAQGAGYIATVNFDGQTGSLAA